MFYELTPYKFSKPLICRAPPPNLIIKDFSIGIPLNIFSNVYTNLHYGYDITNPESIGLQFLLGYFAYGYDRLKDAYQYQNSTDITIYPDSKIELYNNILELKDFYSISLHLSLLAIIYLMIIKNYDNSHVPFIGLLYISATYKEYKTYLNMFKPLFIAVMWTITSVGLPCVLNDNNFDIFMYPQDYLPCLLFIFSASNFADISDIEEDRTLGINTIPVKYGENITKFISLLAVSLAAIILVENPNYETRFWINSIIEMQHFGLMYTIYNNTKF